MSKNKDRDSFLQSQICHFIPGEEALDRHQRRYDLAVDNIESVKTWCQYRSIQVRFKSSRDWSLWCWDFRLPNTFVQWMPWTGKANYKASLSDKLGKVKVYDTEQLLRLLEFVFEQGNNNDQSQE